MSKPGVKRDALSERYWDMLVSQQSNGWKRFEIMAEWIRDHEAESFFAVKLEVIRRELERLTSAANRIGSDTRNGKLYDACKVLRRTVNEVRDELRRWKKSTTQPLSHRERDRNRRPAPRHDYVKSCTTLLQVIGPLRDNMYDLESTRAERRRQACDRNVIALW